MNSPDVDPLSTAAVAMSRTLENGFGAESLRDYLDAFRRALSLVKDGTDREFLKRTVTGHMAGVRQRLNHGIERDERDEAMTLVHMVEHEADIVLEPTAADRAHAATASFHSAFTRPLNRR